MRPSAVAIRKAGSKGRGLFAMSDIAADTYLCDYAGELLDESEINARYVVPDADYSHDSRRYVVGVASPMGELYFVDARDEQQVSPGRWLNHAADGTHNCNVGTACYFPLTGLDVRLCMTTLRDVQAGEELQVRALHPDHTHNYGRALTCGPTLRECRPVCCDSGTMGTRIGKPWT